MANVVTISIFICTIDRPKILERCLRSVAASSWLPDQVIVSDDSRDPKPTQAVCAAYPFVRYLAGPRRGISANRNRARDVVSTTHVALLDDDAKLGPDFVRAARTVLPRIDDKTILTGPVIEYGGRTFPRNPNFWGHFQAEPRGTQKTINLNCNIFPAQAFHLAAFDEAVLYGYEDMDFCASLIAKGYRIEYEPSLANEHLPPPRSAADLHRRFGLVQRARFQTSLKRYALWERSWPRFAAYIVLAPFHRSGHAIKAGRWDDIPHAFADIAFAAAGALRARAQLRSPRARRGSPRDTA